MDDAKVARSLRGWIKQEADRIARKRAKTLRVPPGYVLAHKRGCEARKGFGYGYADLQTVANRLLQHKHEGYR